MAAPFHNLTSTEPAFSWLPAQLNSLYITHQRSWFQPFNPCCSALTPFLKFCIQILQNCGHECCPHPKIVDTIVCNDSLGLTSLDYTDHISTAMWNSEHQQIARIKMRFGEKAFFHHQLNVLNSFPRWKSSQKMVYQYWRFLCNFNKAAYLYFTQT